MLNDFRPRVALQCIYLHEVPYQQLLEAHGLLAPSSFSKANKALETYYRWAYRDIPSIDCSYHYETGPSVYPLCSQMNSGRAPLPSRSSRVMTLPVLFLQLLTLSGSKIDSLPS